MQSVALPGSHCWSGVPQTQIHWAGLYREAELYKATVRLYTKPLFSWRKALTSSTDRRTLFDFARHGLSNLDHLHKKLSNRTFHFRPGLALPYNFNGKPRTLYIYPWEERLVDLLLYRLLNQRFHAQFSPHSYAYRFRGFGVDRCQRKVAQALRPAKSGFLYVAKRDVVDYFSSIDHDLLLAKMESWVKRDDYLFDLLKERVLFTYWHGASLRVASRGIPFGTAMACFFANLYLTDMDHRMSEWRGVFYARYSDDLILVSSQRETLLKASRQVDSFLDELKLRIKPSHRRDLVLSRSSTPDPEFLWVDRFRHLGLEFRANGVIGLSRDKFRKICNLFRYSFRRQAGRFRKMKDEEKRAKLAVSVAQMTVGRGIRNVAIIDYYLKHVQDENQLRLLDRWLAEEVLFIVYGKGHKKGRFRKLSFQKLRAMGLPSLVHRRRLLLHGHLESSFFIWKNHRGCKESEEAAASLPARTNPFGGQVSLHSQKQRLEKAW